MATIPQTSSHTAFEEHYVGAQEAAQFLSVHRRTLLQMARDGIVPAHPIGDGQRHQWRFLISELDVWMRSRLTLVLPSELSE